jgi:hypothetical protein
MHRDNLAMPLSDRDNIVRIVAAPHNVLATTDASPDDRPDPFNQLSRGSIDYFDYSSIFNC